MIQWALLTYARPIYPFFSQNLSKLNTWIYQSYLRLILLEAVFHLVRPELVLPIYECHFPQRTLCEGNPLQQTIIL